MMMLPSQQPIYRRQLWRFITSIEHYKLTTNSWGCCELYWLTHIKQCGYSYIEYIVTKNCYKRMKYIEYILLISIYFHGLIKYTYINGQHNKINDHCSLMFSTWIGTYI